MVKAYTINRSLEEGIILEEDGTISVGQPGRGRKLVTVPLPSGAEISPAEPYRPARVMSVPARDAVAVILIRDHSGFRGSWRLAEFAEYHCPRSNMPSEECFGHSDKCPECGGYYSHRLLPHKSIEPGVLGRVIAEGACAQGAAGRAGGGPEYLIAAKPCRFSIRRSGRLYGAPSVLNVTVAEDGTVTVEDAEAVIDSRNAASAW